MVFHGTTTAVITLALAGLAFAPMTSQDDGAEILLDFRSESGGRWFAVNDGVMGGRSSSAMRSTSEGGAVFEGNLSLENNGGFASVRTDVSEGSLSGFTRLLIHVRGDGKRYQIRLRTSTAFDGVAYAAGFETVANEWTTVEIPLASFAPTFRGYRPRNAAPLEASEVRQIGVMVTDKQEGPFRLEIAWIGAGHVEG